MDFNRAKIQVDDRYVKAFFAPFKDEEERPDGVIAVIQDITEHVKLDNMQKRISGRCIT